MKNIFRAAALVASVAALVPAQTNGPSIADIVGRKVAHLTRLLTLTTAQANQATSIFTTGETTLSGLRTSFQTAQAALKTAVEADSATGIAAAARQIGALDIQSIEARATADAAFYAILTTSQQAIFNELPPGGPGDGPPGGPGGGPGRGGPPPR